MQKTQLFDLDGKIALVTGASRGIGEAIARLLAQQGAHVIVSSRKIDDCQQVADSIIAAGGKASAMACHIGEMEQIIGTVEAIRQQFGKLDILVNNAATNPYFGNVLDTDLGAFQKTVDGFNEGVRDFSEFNYNLRGTVERMDVSVRDLVGGLREVSRELERSRK